MNLDNAIERLESERQTIQETRDWLNKVRDAVKQARNAGVESLTLKRRDMTGSEYVDKVLVRMTLGDADVFDVIDRMNRIGALEMSAFQYSRTNDTLQVSYKRDNE